MDNQDPLNEFTESNYDDTGIGEYLFFFLAASAVLLSLVMAFI